MRGILIGSALVLAALPAWAQTQQQIDLCYSPTATDDQTIDGCTAMIQSGRYSGAELSHAFNNRAEGYIGKHEWDQVIQDDNQAIQVDPTNAQAYNNRGIAYKNKGLVDQAISEYTQAIALKPDYADAYYNRGLAYETKGQRDQAISDYRASLGFNPGDGDTLNAMKRLGVTP
jgi:tetratricopeptide (TPR) repeat protein